MKCDAESQPKSECGIGSLPCPARNPQVKSPQQDSLHEFQDDSQQESQQAAAPMGRLLQQVWGAIDNEPDFEGEEKPLWLESRLAAFPDYLLESHCTGAVPTTQSL